MELAIAPFEPNDAIACANRDVESGEMVGALALFADMAIAVLPLAVTVLPLSVSVPPPLSVSVPPLDEVDAGGAASVPLELLPPVDTLSPRSTPWSWPLVIHHS